MKRWQLLLLIAQLVLLPVVVWATGSLSIPNVIGAQSGPNLAASLLDANWNAIRDYINNRELTIGTLAARPAAGTSGRYYFASDDVGGTLYGDTGATWTQLSPAVAGSRSLYAVRDLSAATATATNTTLNVTANLMTLWSPSDNTTRVAGATTTKSNSILTAGPAANGRDRASTFSASSWVHFYYIYSASAVSLDTLSSPCAPSDYNGSCSSNGGPVLPSTYTHFAYIGPVYLTSTGTLRATYIRGSRAYLQSAAVIVSGTVPSSSTAFNYASAVSPNAQSAILNVAYSASTNDTMFVQLVNGTDLVATNGILKASLGLTNARTWTVPNLSQEARFYATTGGTTQISVLGYGVPNGGD